MKDEFQYFKGSKNPVGIIQSLHFDSVFYQNNPDYFHPDGIWVFVAHKGLEKRFRL